MPTTGRPTRRYISPRRQQTAAQTRQAILDAAQALFVHQGYVATTIEQIAEAAGVSKPTVFASVGNKRAIIKQLRDLAIAGDNQPVALAQRPWFKQALDEPDPRRSLRLHARNVVRLHQAAGDLAEVLRSGAGADQELRDLWQTAEHERRVDAGTIIDALLRNGPLKAGLDREGAVDILWILASADNFQRLVRARAWSTQRYEHWLAQTLLDQLLPPNHRQTQHTQEAKPASSEAP
jgi:AcrR family transcriptional regulator